MLLKDITNYDPFVAISDTPLDANAFFQTEGIEFKMRSSILSQYILRTEFDAIEIMDGIEKILITAATSAQDRLPSEYGTFVTFSRAAILLDGMENRSRALRAFYERLRGNRIIASEPLFWLQFSFVYTSDEDFGIAKEMLNRAYDEASKLDGFDPYQIDTHALRVWLDSGASDEDVSNEDIERITELMLRASDLLSSSRHSSYVIKALDHVKPFIFNRIDDLSVGQKHALETATRSLIAGLETLDTVRMIRTESNETANSLRRALGALERSRQ